MKMDIAVFVLFAITVFFSMRKGFAVTVANFISGIFAIAVCVFYRSKIKDFIMEKTRLDELVATKVQHVVNSKIESSEFLDALPLMLKNRGGFIQETLASDAAERFTDIFFSLLAIVLAVVAIKIVAGLIILLFSYKKNGGFTGFTDWLLGGLLGVILGGINVFIFLAVLVPVSSLFLPSVMENLPSWFEGSYYSEMLYDNNLILVLLRDLV